MADTYTMTQKEKDALAALTKVGTSLAPVIDIAKDTIETAVDVTTDSLNTVSSTLPIPGMTAVTASAQFMTNNAETQFNGFFQNLTAAFNPAAMLQQIKTPQALLDKFAEQEAFKTPEGLKLIEIARNDPEFAQALHAAITKDPSVAAGIMSSEKGSFFDPATLATSLEDPSSRQTITGVLNAVAKSPSDDLNFQYLKDVADAAKKISSENATQEDYKKFQQLLARANVSNAKLDMAADPMKAIGDYFNDPVGYSDNIVAMSGFQGEQAEALRELLRAVGSMIELVIGGSDGGYRGLAQRLVPQAIASGTDFIDRISGNADVAATAQAVVNVTPTTTYGLRDNVGFTPVFTERDLDAMSINRYLPTTNSHNDTSDLAGAENNTKANLSLVSKFNAAHDGETPQPIDLRLPVAPTPAELRMQSLNF